jgi:hypothetical protein
MNWLVQPKSAQSGCTEQCPVRQAGSGELAALGTSTVVYGNKSPDCPVVHRTVRWCTGLSGEPFTGELVKGKCALGPFLSILVIECKHKGLNVNLCTWMNKVKIMK